MKYEVKDVPSFKAQVCKKTCVMCGSCIDEQKDDNWFLMCPHYHSWKLQYDSFVVQQLRYDREHPEEVESRHQKNIELAKKYKKKK